MKKLNFDIEIHAPKNEVWQVLWNDATYRQWTSVFSEGSHAVSDWKEGSKISFLDPNGDGMASRIEKVTPNEFMSFKHLGVIKKGEEVPMDNETRKWSGAMENYTLRQVGDVTELKVDIDVADEHYDSFKDIFPKALQKVKDISEKNMKAIPIH
jgi:hypothetical protein